ncbi:MAG: hypothetical protein IJI07_01670 [Flexilinea sp.]|nr:hypothetical protein [Flexilinea sp.]
MRIIRSFLIIFTVLLLLTASVASVFAQDIDLENMDNAQLTELLQQIMQKLEQKDLSADETDQETSPVGSVAAVPAADPEPTPEAVVFSIYENKKLMIEKLPEYMFIQPTQPPKPEKPEKKDGGSKSGGGDDIRVCLDPCYSSCPFQDWDCMEDCFISCGGKR